jgi:ABC-type transporter Mla MlaB component
MSQGREANHGGWHIEIQNHTLVIDGEVTLATIDPVLAKIASMTQLEFPQNVDLSRLGLCDSSAVALVLELQRRGASRVQHAPSAFIAIVQACQLGALFPDLAQNHTSL